MNGMIKVAQIMGQPNTRPPSSGAQAMRPRPVGSMAPSLNPNAHTPDMTNTATNVKLKMKMANPFNKNPPSTPMMPTNQQPKGMV